MIIRLFILLIIVLYSNIVLAGSISLVWNPSPEPDIDGYKLYYREDSGQEKVVDVGNVVVYELTGLITGAYYTVEATAYDMSGNESQRSYGVRSKSKYSIVTGLEVSE